MQVAVKARRTEFRIEGDVPPWLLEELYRRYGRRVRIVDDDRAVRIEDSEWFRAIRRETTPGDSLRLYRRNRGLSQVDLARRLGAGVSKQHISDMENGRRGISKEMAKRLAAVFSTSVERFI
jgi:DNA-binding XRE family transcriptional regulator